MNRMLLIPCVASCLDFVFLAGANHLEYSGAKDCANGNNIVNGDAKAGVLMSSQQVQDELIAQWNRYNEDKYRFSRVYRPRARYQTPGILVNETLPAPEGSFIGIFTLETARPALTDVLGSDGQIEEPPKPVDVAMYPLVVDRRTGGTMIFASGKWSEFSQWAVAGE